MEERGLLLKDSLVGIESPDDIMMNIMETFTETEVTPEVGKYYTFVYSPKTPNLYYDQYPLVACLEIFRKCFINYIHFVLNQETASSFSAACSLSQSLL